MSDPNKATFEEHMNLKIEWVMAAHIHDDVGLVEPHAVRAVPVVRLEEVDALIGEAVMFAEWIVRLTDCECDENQDARTFLASRDVAKWREREEGRK